MQKIMEWVLKVNPGIGQKFRARVREEVLHNPHLAAKFYPFEVDRGSYFIRKVGPADRPDGSELPIPPPELRLHGGPPERYLERGKDLVGKMMGVLEAAGRPLGPGGRVLDFGCCDGMMIRNFHDFALTANSEVWGVDIDGTHVAWNQQHLSPPFRFATTTSFPHLPFEDNYFDLIYAGSVFTHIADLAEAWLLELKRIARPGGRLYLTVHDYHSIELLGKTENPLIALVRKAAGEFEREGRCALADCAMFTCNRTPGYGGEGEAHVFYDIEYLRRHWGNYLKVVSVTPEAYKYQTAVLLEK